MVMLRVLVVAAAPVGVDRSRHHVAIAVGIEQCGRIAGLVTVEQRDGVRGVAREVAVDENAQAILVEPREGLVILGEVNRSREAGLVLGPTVALERAG